MAQVLGSVAHGVAVLAAAGVWVLIPQQAEAADPPSESQLERLMATAARATDRPDHDYVSNSLKSMLHQAKDLGLSQEQTDKIKTITEQYERTGRDREAAYKQSEMDALKLIHDSHSSLTSVESAVQKADQEHTKLRMAGIRALREARDVLRPEQYSHWRQGHAAQVARSSMPHDPGDRDKDELERIPPHQ
ncbi:MAG TPA: hypothetical protein VFS39_10500 [Nitrospira sp.]|nr:hypothetical protein [Nitrospira sp.]